ncbi:MAG TPA: 3-oxoacyl-ACP reductase family protein [Terriglobales bacterium]|nr:3-oxoacyl-ACP reductase family protein [Terriglobales bacterium]
MTVPSVNGLLDFSGKRVLVTGAGSGLGGGIALRFAEAGASVAVHYRKSETGASRLVAEIEKLKRKAVAIQADVSRARDVAKLVEKTVAALGGLDVLVNNAGTYPVSPLVEMREEEWDSVIADNLTSVHLCTQAAARHMMENGGGAIIDIASIEAENPAPGHSHYNAAKAGVVMYTRTAAQELGQHGIRVNAVSPGLIWREGIEQAWPEGVEAYLRAVPLERLGQANDVADACLFLASPAARWITGANLVVDGGVMTRRIF